MNPEQEVPPGRSGDQKTLDDADAVLSGTSKKGRLARLLPFLGPAFIASIAYVDPGNFATNIAAGAYVNGNPAIPYQLERRIAVLQQRLPDLFKRVEALEKNLE